MGWLSNKTKTKPSIVVEGTVISYCPDAEIWSFEFSGLEFMSAEPRFSLPEKAQLEEIARDFKELQPEMRRRLEKGWEKWGGPKIDTGETCLVNLTDLAGEGIYEICWSGGEKWGDMGIDFSIKEHAIIDESWGD